MRGFLVAGLLVEFWVELAGAAVTVLVLFVAGELLGADGFVGVVDALGEAAAVEVWVDAEAPGSAALAGLTNITLAAMTLQDATTVSGTRIFWFDISSPLSVRWSILAGRFLLANSGFKKTLNMAQN